MGTWSDVECVLECGDQRRDLLRQSAVCVEGESSGK